ncbi:MAG: hypothetical protein K0V04_40060 [Deltaproteobacteria bacterium]|nr:hypothetical protein [Deltaproteobacteria bacterium]
MPVFPTAAIALGTLLYSAPDAAQEAKVKEIFDEWCTTCHIGGGNPASDPSEVDLAVPLSSLVGIPSAANGQPLVVPGDPDASYLLTKMRGGEGMEGEVMPLGDDPLPPEQLQIVSDWIAGLPPPDTGGGTTGGGTADGGDVPPPPKSGKAPFHGTSQITLPTTTTLGKRVLQYRIDHRFGRIGAERGAFGLDGGVSMAMGLQYGILDGWDVALRRANSRKTWELGTKYVPLRQEDGQALSLGGYVALSYLRDFDVANPWVGDFQVMVSRLWFDRWSTMVTVGYHLNTNHNTRVSVDFGDGTPVPVRDKRDTMALGLASTVWLGKRRRWGIDMEYVLPIPDGSTPNVFYYRGGDADTSGSRIGSWSLGGSLKTAKHFFQVFFSNNREIATNLSAPGGQSGNPFATEGVDSNNPFHKFNFFLGFNLGRKFNIKAPKGRKSKSSATAEVGK